MATIVTACTLTLLLGYLDKARCVGPPFGADGRSLIFDRIKDRNVCYSDIQYLWLGRGIDLHLFPYVGGGITRDGLLTGGTVEYPVLSGLLMWLGGIGAHTDAAFLEHSALLLAPFGLATAWMLGRLAGRRALLWAAAPPLLLYAFHNWELPVVATAVGAIFVMASNRWSLRTRAVLAAVLLGVGFCLKLYPGLFVLPLALYVLTEDRTRGRFDVRGAVAVIGAAATTVIAINLPFALAGYDGWRASFAFQQLRKADLTSNSIWYWGLRPLMGGGQQGSDAYHHFVGVASPLLLCAVFALALWLGWKRYEREGSYPWIGVSGAMLCAFLLLHKVHSPQYTLWLIPFLVLLRVPWSLVGAYLLADLTLGIGVFRYFDALVTGADGGVAEAAVQLGVWVQAVLLSVFFFRFLWARPRQGVGDHVVRPGAVTSGKSAPDAQSVTARLPLRQ
ncbi:glycosyltransferase 87 family protein [Rhodococcus sp. ABRD24]|uniref:glycosyltransferase family 87 protein n=1 Tax=Rhodococcus sp. ABRD24 TaxID=2507582 RepID=UPI001F61B691|nr:glycosyltransferase 87 family protein [Rhodococcus sp. ABRD24]